MRSTITICVGALVATVGGALAIQNAQPQPGITPEMLDAFEAIPGELAALPEVEWPADNQPTAEKIELGRQLYFDPRLSLTGSMSCATCHHPDFGYGDGHALSKGVTGNTLGRHSPTVLNAAYNDPQFWDGRAHGLEEQAIGPIMAAGEMAMPTPEELIRRLNHFGYDKQFNAVFGQEPTLPLVGKAIAAFERTLVTPNAPFDKYADGDKSALNEQEKRGLALFIGKASCTSCHSGYNFTDNKFHALGVGTGEDKGRWEVTKKDEDIGAFKTPTLRNVTLTAPYMHDGSEATLHDVIRFYNKGGGDLQPKSNLMFPLDLTESEIDDLVAFLHTLEGDQPEVDRRVPGMLAGVDDE